MNNNTRVRGRILLPLTPEQTWSALNDPEILAACIRGCDHVEQEHQTTFAAVILASWMNYRREFKVRVEVEPVKVPEFYRMSARMGAGFLGKAQGLAEVRLKAVSFGTELEYESQLSGSGLVAKALPMLEATAGRRVDEFFELFAAKVSTLK